MTNEEYIALVNKWQTQACYASRNKAVMGLVNLVHNVANRFKTNNSRDDLFSEGIIGAMKACDSFSSEKNALFLTYARVCIKNYMLNFLRTDHVIPRGSKSMHSSNLSFHPVPTRHSEVEKLSLLADVSYESAQRYASMGHSAALEEAGDVITTDTTYEQVVMLERCEQLAERLEQVKDREQQMMNEHFFEEKTYKEIGDEHDVSSQRVQQIIKHVVQKLGVI
jgi:RNA polymerase sigma factor (sigma-70 family)